MKRTTSFSTSARLLLAGALVGTAFSAGAVQAKRGLRTLPQPDGSQIEVELRGDENFHALFTTDNLPVRADNAGVLRYVTTDGLSTVAAHSPALRQADELAFINANANKMEAQALRQEAVNAVALRRGAAKTQAGPLRTTGSREDAETPCMGEQHIPIILVEYSDVSFIDGDSANVTLGEVYNNDEGKTVRRYFRDQSRDLYQPYYDVYGPVRLSKTRSYYGSNDWFGNDGKPGEMVAEACQLVEGLDLTAYDHDNDGKCDVMIIVYAGEGEADSGRSNSSQFIWPHQWYLSSSDYGSTLSVGGKIVDKYAAFNELAPTSSNAETPKINGIGTFCHEFSHCLGLPDFYDTNYGGHFGMDCWSLMDYGSYADDGYTPPAYTAYEKEFMGWMEIEEADNNTFYTLQPNNYPDWENHTDRALRVRSDANPNEYFLLEVRKQMGWNTFDPAEGLMITHVDYNASRWTSNTPNNYSDQGMTIFAADNSLSRYSTSGDLYPYAGNDKLTDDSRPAAKLNGGGYMGKPIIDIARNEDDGSVSFWFNKGVLPILDTPELIEPDGTDALLSSFTASWEPVENAASYDLQLVDRLAKSAEQYLDTDFATGSSSDWAASNAEYSAADSCLIIGADTATGSITSKEMFEPDELGEMTIAINCHSNADETKVKLSASLRSAAGRAVASKSQTLVPNDSLLIYVLKGTPGDTYKVAIATTSRAKHAYVSRVRVIAGNATETLMNPDDEPVVDTSRNIKGITETSVLLDSLHPGGLYLWRVKANTPDPEAFDSSEWSSYMTTDLNLLQPTAIKAVANDEVAGSLLDALRVEGQTLYAPTDARVFTPAGMEILPAAPGMFRMSMGLYIVVTPNATAKISMK